MLECPLTDFASGIGDGSGSSLICVTDQSFYLADNGRLVFCPDGVRVSSDGHSHELESPEIPIRKIEPDSSLEEVMRSLIVRRPKNLYIRLTDISKAVAWWIVNNAEELGWPETVEIAYTGVDGNECSAEFIRTGKRKWEPGFGEKPRPDSSVRREFDRIRREMWNEDV